MAVNIEDAGFEIRDLVMWHYGCLDEQTEVATSEGVKPYHNTKLGDTVLCYNVENGKYSYQPILEIVEYDYSDTAYRLVGDFGEQVVSRNHRVIVERGGKEVFEFAENVARQQQARIPVLESLPALQQAFYDTRQASGCEKQGMQPKVCQRTDRQGQQRAAAARAKEGAVHFLCGLWQESVEAGCLVKEGFNSCLQSRMQWGVARCGVESPCPQRAGLLEARVRTGSKRAHDGGDQPSLEGWPNLPKAEGGIRRPADQVCTLPSTAYGDGEEGWLRYGTSADCCSAGSQGVDQGRMCTPSEPRRNRQPDAKSNAVCNQCRPQEIRAWAGHKTAMVRVVPFHYTGKVWCLRVPTGAFVAVRNGVAFPTGNSGFPKSLSVDKAIDRAAGADREVVGVREDFAARAPKNNFDQFSAINPSERGINSQAFAAKMGQITAPATPAAKQWAGWGTALKPATEIVTMARKPFPGTVAANVLEWGTGGINVDGCRVEMQPGDQKGEFGPRNVGLGDNNTNGIYGGGFARQDADESKGRWPANLIHSGCDEVVAGFPETGASSTNPDRFTGTNKFKGTTFAADAYSLQMKSGQAAVYGDSGSAARFFYCAKASKSDRNEGLDDSNGHPTVKPTDLMRYLCRLVTPPGGVVLDPYMGSGSTGKAAYLEGFQFIGIEQDPAFVAIARARIAAAVQRSEMMTLEQRVAWLETQVQAQGAKLRKIEAHQQMSIFDALGATP
jgi:site-specific DNA-methyltransferase (adenine-specific)